jgi:hypothetical protein
VFRFKDDILIRKYCGTETPEKISPTVVDILRYCSNAETELLHTDPQKFEDVSLVFEKEVNWQKVLEHASSGVGQQGADVWTKNGKITLVHEYISARSGDWLHQNSYCFRDDGTLALIEGTFNTFQTEEEPGLSLLRKAYYDLTGNEIASSTKVVNWETRKPSASPYADQEIRVYWKTDELPFRRLVEF